MTQKTIATDSNGNQVKTPGWFSWRCKTRDAHDVAVAEYLSEHGPAARKLKAREREERYGSPANHASSRGHALGRCSCSPVGGPERRLLTAIFGAAVTE